MSLKSYHNLRFYIWADHIFIRPKKKLWKWNPSWNCLKLPFRWLNKFIIDFALLDQGEVNENNQIAFIFRCRICYNKCLDMLLPQNMIVFYINFMCYCDWDCVMPQYLCLQGLDTFIILFTLHFTLHCLICRTIYFGG